MKRQLYLLLKVLPAVALFACANAYTTVEKTWKSPTFGGMKSVLVIGIAREQATRREFEDDFAGQLRKRNVTAIPSYTVFPEEKIASKEQVAAYAKEKGIDAILITRVTSRKDVQTYVPGSIGPYTSYWSYYGYGWDYAYSPGYTVQEEKVVLETNLYNAANEQLEWTAISDTTTGGEKSDVIKSFIPAIVDKMAKDKLF